MWHLNEMTFWKFVFNWIFRVGAFSKPFVFVGDPLFWQHVIMTQIIRVTYFILTAFILTVQTRNSKKKSFLHSFSALNVKMGAENSLHIINNINLFGCLQENISTMIPLVVATIRLHFQFHLKPEQNFKRLDYCKNVHQTIFFKGLHPCQFFKKNVFNNSFRR